MGDDISIGLMITGEDNTIQLVANKDDSAIDISSTK